MLYVSLMDLKRTHAASVMDLPRPHVPRIVLMFQTLWPGLKFQALCSRASRKDSTVEREANVYTVFRTIQGRDVETMFCTWPWVSMGKEEKCSSAMGVNI